MHVDGKWEGQGRFIGITDYRGKGTVWPDVVINGVTTAIPLFGQLNQYLVRPGHRESDSCIWKQMLLSFVETSRKLAEAFAEVAIKLASVYCIDCSVCFNAAQYSFTNSWKILASANEFRDSLTTRNG
ncbi:hypothetical protein GJ496_003840 [Pomphorhynchus laevis]|nr:hypothetical protein GJ496_003840 [Pomphorhynchus laevis]